MPQGTVGARKEAYMNILLTAINAKYIHSNLAVYSLRAYVPEYREEIQIAEYTINQQVDNILMDLYRKKPDILCFSCYIWNLDYVEQLVREAGKILPGVPIWIGGPKYLMTVRQFFRDFRKYSE